MLTLLVKVIVYVSFFFFPKELVPANNFYHHFLEYFFMLFHVVPSVLFQLLAFSLKLFSSQSELSILRFFI